MALAVVALALLFNVAWSYDPVLPCAVFDASLPQCAWSRSYAEARSKFLAAMQPRASIVDSLALGGGLFVDVAEFTGRPDHVVVHISGTHGVEGYVGSAVQIAASAFLAPNASGPTVVLVHVLNPFGMRHTRRFNENNVDLNRNALFGAEAEAARNRDPNIAGYEDLDAIINPRGPLTWPALLRWAVDAASVALSRGGFARIRRALVTGTYTRAKGMYFGGRDVQPSTRLVVVWLARRGHFARADKVAIVDVHSGLGEFAKDTLMLQSDFAYDALVTAPRQFGVGVKWIRPHSLERISGDTSKQERADASVGCTCLFCVVHGSHAQTTLPRALWTTACARSSTSPAASTPTLRRSSAPPRARRAWPWRWCWRTGPGTGAAPATGASPASSGSSRPTCSPSSPASSRAACRFSSRP